MSIYKCKICGSSNLKKLFTSQNVHGRHLLGSENFDIYECLQCKVAFTDVKIDEHYYKKYYPGNYYETEINIGLVQKALGWLNKWGIARRLEIINEFKPSRGKKILDIGCARGEFLNTLPDYFKKYGVEINKDGYSFVKNNYPNITVYNQKIDSKEFDTNQSFDIIVMWHVLEHIDNPNTFFKALNKLLSKDGVLILEIPNRNSLGFNLAKDKWFHLDTPRHLFHYNYACLGALLKKNDLRIASYSADPLSYFHDLSFSIFAKLKQNNWFIDFFLFVLVVPSMFIIRLLCSLFFPRIAEINTYIIKRANNKN